MGRLSDYKKTTTKECWYCDYFYTCRNGHPCTWYKKFVKKVASNKGARKMQVIEQIINVFLTFVPGIVFHYIIHK